MAGKTCKVADCEWAGQLRRGMCKPHYRRYMQWGDPTFNLTAPRHLDAWGRIEFYGWVVTPGPLSTDCWIFDQGTSSRKGYGSIRYEGRTLMAHRVSYSHFNNEEIPPGLLVLHGCDTPTCINPEHLRTGTVKDNSADAIARGRHKAPRGAINGSAVLDDDKVRAILKMRAETQLSYSQIAREFEVSMSLIAFIVTGKRWAHVSEPWMAENPDADLKTKETYS